MKPQLVEVEQELRQAMAAATAVEPGVLVALNLERLLNASHQLK